MQALSDERRIESLEKKIDDGFAEMRTEFRAVRGELNDVRAEMQTEFKAVRTEMQTEFKAVRAVTQADFKAVRAGRASRTDGSGPDADPDSRRYVCGGGFRLPRAGGEPPLTRIRR
jgi:ribosome recycling factor